MSGRDFTKVVKEFGAAKWYPNPRRGLFGKDWFLLEIFPLPPKSELELVLSDILDNEYIRVENGKVRHSSNCSKEAHELPHKFKEVVHHLSDSSFKIAIYSGERDLYKGQPLAISLEPPITYTECPDHPHLNAGAPVIIDGKHFYMPDSFCYYDDYSNLGNAEEEFFLHAFDQIVIWLFRHQIWETSKKLYGEGEWIGPHKPFFEPKVYPQILNPIGKCRCCSNKNYIDCCMPSDLSQLANKHLNELKDKANDAQSRVAWVQQWKNTRYIPQAQSLKLLKEVLIGLNEKGIVKSVE